MKRRRTPVGELTHPATFVPAGSSRGGSRMTQLLIGVLLRIRRQDTKPAVNPTQQSQRPVLIRLGGGLRNQVGGERIPGRLRRSLGAPDYRRQVESSDRDARWEGCRVREFRAEVLCVRPRRTAGGPSGWISRRSWKRRIPTGTGWATIGSERLWAACQSVHPE